jgi:hypothetical protein
MNEQEAQAMSNDMGAVAEVEDAHTPSYEAIVIALGCRRPGRPGRRPAVFPQRGLTRWNRKRPARSN